MKPSAAIIFTDLDGTLLDHHDYRFDAALPALQAARERNIPLILTTSKTLAEVLKINRALGNSRPAIVENGCALCFPLEASYPFDISGYEQMHGCAVRCFSPSYPQIRDFIARQRDRHGWQLRGFADMSTAEVAEVTGLHLDQAADARQRLCSEPFLWLDSDENLARFITNAETVDMRVTRGGRFWHLMGKSSKAVALDTMRGLFYPHADARTTVIALGDSENDRDMLQNADIAVVIKRHDGIHLDCTGRMQTIYTQQAGPAGWNSAVLQIIKQLDRENRQS
jgi:mannosyl-3-phosphoglycerate phosphatase